jgi:predicted RNase H-like nuclease (RuvC/YqgF family)
MMEYLSLILNLVLGGGVITQFLTMRSIRKKANSEAKGTEATAESTELDNVEKAIRIWREMAENLKIQLNESNNRYIDMARELQSLRKDVQRLTCTSNRILKLLDKITHENMDKIVNEIKQEIKSEDE